MFKLITAASLAAAAFGTPAAHAASPIIVNALQFRTIEASMPREPLSGSADALGDRHVTPHQQIASVERALNTAIPAGTSADDAVATLRKAGAHCGSNGRCSFLMSGLSTNMSMTCTRNASLQLNSGRVQHVALERCWARH